MPNQTVTIKLHDAKTIISAFQVTKTHDQPVTIQAQKGINYELIDDATQFAPENIKIQRVGDDLYISFEVDGDSALDPDLIIQGYYGTDGNTTNLLIGLHENGNYYAYVPESGLQQNAVSMLADQMSAGQALGGEALTSAAYEFNPYWLLALIPIVGLAAAAAANNDSGDKGDTGATGQDGKDGKSVLDFLIEKGELPEGSDVNDMINYLKGADGQDGANGSNGKSVLELLIEVGELPAGSDVNDMINYLKGADGADGQDGQDGLAGSADLIASTTLNDDKDSNGKLTQRELLDGESTITIVLGADVKEGDKIFVNGTQYILSPNDIDAKEITVPVEVIDGLNFIRIDAVNDKGQTDIDFKLFEVLAEDYLRDIQVVSDLDHNNVIATDELGIGNTIDVRVQLGIDVREGDVVTLNGVDKTVQSIDILQGYLEFNDLNVTLGELATLSADIKTGTTLLDTLSESIQIDGSARNIVEAIVFPDDLNTNGILNATELNGKFYTPVQITLGADAQVGDIVSVNGDKYSLTATEVQYKTLNVFMPVREGGNPVEVAAMDEWGNVDTVHGSIVVDILPPLAPILAPIAIDDVPLIMGEVPNNGLTNDNLPEITGSGRNQGEIITLYINGSVVTPATPIVVAEDGTWSYTPDVPLVDDNYIVTYTVSDSNGNTTIHSPTLSFEVDTSAPIGGAVTIDTPIAGDDIVNATEADGDIIVTGTVTIPADATTTEVTVTVNGQDYLATVIGNIWTVTIPGSEFADGEGNVDAKAEFSDLAGNTNIENAVPAPYTLDIPAELSDARLDEVVSGSTVKTGTNLTFDIVTLPTLTVAGSDVEWSGTGTTINPLIATVNGEAVLTISINDNGDFSIIQSQAIDHPDTGADELSVTLNVLSNGVQHDVLKLNIVDDVPKAALDNTANLTHEVTQGADTLFVSQPQTYRGTAVETFGGDLEGAHVSQVNIDGAIFSFDGTVLTETTLNPMVVTYHQVMDSTGTYLVATTARGETVKVDLYTGNYTVEVTGQGVNINEAPVATINAAGGLLGIVDANVLGIVDLSETQMFSVSDVNENLKQVEVSLTADLTGLIYSTPLLDTTLSLLDFLGLGLGSLLNYVNGGLAGLLSTLGLSNYKLEWSQDLAQELGLKVVTAGQTFDGGLFGSKLTITSLDNTPVSSQVLNEFLGSIYIDSAALGIDLKVAPTYTLTATDSFNLSDTSVHDSLIDAGVLDDLLGSNNQSSSAIIMGSDAGNIIDQSTADSAVRIYGLDGDDIITGSDYADIIRGGIGNDNVDGGAGNDIIIGGEGDDILTGGLGRDVFRWEAGDQGLTLTTDIITDFDIRSVAQGGDILDFSDLLPDATRVGVNSVNISQYIEFVEVGTDTQVRISTQGDTANPDQIIILEGVEDFVEQFSSQEELINYLLQSGKLIIAEETLDSATYATLKDDDTLNLGIIIQDGDGDSDTHQLDLTVGSLEAANQYQPDYDPTNVAPIVSVNQAELLGLVGVDALGLLDLSHQQYRVIDINDNLQRVELTYQPVVNVGLTRGYYDVSNALAAELGLKVESVTEQGLLNLVGYSNTLVITALDGGTISNLAINELLAAVQLKAEDGTLLTGELLTANVINSVSLTAIDSQGAFATEAGARLLDVNLLDNFSNGGQFIFEGGTTVDTLDYSTKTTGVRLYGYDGDDILTGGSGNDLLRGGTGDDELIGGAGNDLLIGGAGNDQITGDAGSDTLYFEALDNTTLTGGTGGNGTDTWIDFEVGVAGDKIDISDLLVNYSGDGSAASLSDYLSVNSDGTDTTIRIDRDGAGGQYQSTDLVVLKGVDTTLTELITNQQIIL